MDAIQYFADAARWSPDKPEIRFNLGNALYQYESYAEAAGNFELAGKSARDAQLKAKCSLGQGNALFRDAERLYARQAVMRYRESIAAYRQAQELDPDLFDAEYNRKVAERRLQNPPPELPGARAPEPPAPAPGADADSILESTGNSQATEKSVRRTPVERDW